MGGEKMLKTRPDIYRQGSPPHGRGKGRPRAFHANGGGITPAWAGKSCMSRWSRGPGRDHPRMGGEKSGCCRWLIFNQGSPPHGRGKAFIRMGAGLAAGITPAWAGKRSVSIFSAIRDKDHPRMGGEKCGMMQQPTLWLGSPPHGRGKAYIFPTFWGVERITPAWAGKSRLQCRLA